MFEIENFGWNLITIGGCGIVFFSFLAAWGLLDQSRKIWRNKSGRSVSNLVFMAGVFIILSTLVYGIHRGRGTLILFGCIRLPFHVPILLGLLKFKGFSIREIVITLVFAIPVAAMIIFPSSILFCYAAMSIGGIFSLVSQPLELYREKNPGVVSIQLIIIYLISATFWVIYGIADHDPVVAIPSVGYVAMNLTSVSLWLYYRYFFKKKSAPRT